VHGDRHERAVRRDAHAASAGGFAYPAVNVTSSQTLNAALRGFAEAGSDGIVQVTTGGAAYLSGAGDDARGARALAAFAHVAAEGHPTLVGLHTDHCPPDRADAFLGPLLEESHRRVSAGAEPLFQSHMFDGSTLPLEENLRRSAALLAACSEVGVVLELEVGVVGGSEDDVSGEGVAREERYTTTDDLVRVAEVLGTGERGRYLLAATFGNVHGVAAAGDVELRPDHILSNYAGVLKVDGDAGRKADYDPRTWGRKAETAMAERVAAACELVGSAGRSLGS